MYGVELVERVFRKTVPGRGRDDAAAAHDQAADRREQGTHEQR
jgi:hypothetical protein